MDDTKTSFRDQTSSAASADFEALRRDITKLTETVTGLVKAQADVASTTLTDALDSARGSIASTAAQASDRVSTLSSQLEDTIERNPLTSVLIALSVGLVVGMMSQTRR